MMGVYEQRQAGRYMVRARLSAGRVTPAQLAGVAWLSSQFGRGDVHVTTRQDLQIHDVSLDHTANIIEMLAGVGLSTRGGGGNAVRNVTACARASVCSKALFDVTEHAVGLATHLATVARAYQLPRKFKIAFSGCAEDCSFASVSDLGFFAHERDGELGFAVYAGGGFGQNPAAGIEIETFARPSELSAIAEAALRLFDRLGDRGNRARARLRYVLGRLGSDAFIAEYRKERSALSSDGRALAAAAATTVGPVVRSVQGGGAVQVRLPNGNVPALVLVRLARIARQFGNGTVVATQDQDLVLLGVRDDHVAKVIAALEKVGLDGQPALPKVVACTGTSACKLGICHSQGLAVEVTERLRAEAAGRHSPLGTIRISGCPNGCGGHSVASLGFEGRGRRIGDKLQPFYEVLVGGRPAEGNVQFGQRLGTVPAHCIPALTAEIVANGLSAADDIRPLVHRYAETSPSTPDG
jgi:sulfite reductase (ferredoxin)